MGGESGPPTASLLAPLAHRLNEAMKRAAAPRPLPNNNASTTPGSAARAGERPKPPPSPSFSESFSDSDSEPGATGRGGAGEVSSIDLRSDNADLEEPRGNGGAGPSSGPQAPSPGPANGALRGRDGGGRGPQPSRHDSPGPGNYGYDKFDMIKKRRAQGPAAAPPPTKKRAPAKTAKSKARAAQGVREEPPVSETVRRWREVAAEKIVRQFSSELKTELEEGAYLCLQEGEDSGWEEDRDHPGREVLLPFSIHASIYLLPSPLVIATDDALACVLLHATEDTARLSFSFTPETNTFKAAIGESVKELDATLYSHVYAGGMAEVLADVSTSIAPRALAALSLATGVPMCSAVRTLHRLLESEAASQPTYPQLVFENGEKPCLH